MSGTTTGNLSRIGIGTGPAVHAREIRWTSEPLVRREQDPPWNVDSLSHGELLAYTFELQDDLGSVRELLSAALATLARLTGERDRLRASNHYMASQLRELRAKAA